MASVIIVAEPATDRPGTVNSDRRTFQLKERVTSSDLRDPHVAAQLIERIAGRSPTPRTRNRDEGPASIRLDGRHETR